MDSRWKCQIVVVTPVVISSCAFSKSSLPSAHCVSSMWTRKNSGRCGQWWRGPGGFYSPIQYLCLLIQDCKIIMQGIMSPCQVQEGGIKNWYNITPFPLGVYNWTGFWKIETLVFRFFVFFFKMTVLKRSWQQNLCSIKDALFRGGRYGARMLAQSKSEIRKLSLVGVCMYECL